MNTFLFSTYDTWSTRNPYRMGNVGMSSSMVSMVSFYSAICMMFSQVRTTPLLTQACFGFCRRSR